MNYKTHICGGFALGSAVVMTLGIERVGSIGMGALIGASVIGSILPDIDKKGTFIYNRLPLIGVFAKRAGHRKLFHAPLVYSILYAMYHTMIGYNSIVLGLYVGIMSHIVLDTFNKKGIPWLYPFSRKTFYLAKIKTGGYMEDVVKFICIVIGCVILFK